MESNLFLWLLGIVLFWIVAFILAKAGIKYLVKRWPATIYIIGIPSGLLLGFYIHWIVGILGGLFILGLLVGIQQSGTKKCQKCGSYWTRVLREEKRGVWWKCNKCGNEDFWLRA